MKRKCPVCGYLTIDGKWSVCPVCFWEYDGEDETEESGANSGLTIAQARENYKTFGACDRSAAGKVRPPFKSELPDGGSPDADEGESWSRYLGKFFQSMTEQDKCPVVICNLNHEILYLNPAAKKNYAKYGELVGKSILDCHSKPSRDLILKVCEWFGKSRDNNIIFTHHNEKQNKDVYMVALRDADGELIGYYEKHELRSPETMKRYAFDEEDKS